MTLRFIPKKSKNLSECRSVLENGSSCLPEIRNPGLVGRVWVGFSQVGGEFFRLFSQVIHSVFGKRLRGPELREWDGRSEVLGGR
jgi:hypothetical protein